MFFWLSDSSNIDVNMKNHEYHNIKFNIHNINDYQNMGIGLTSSTHSLNEKYEGKQAFIQ